MRAESGYDSVPSMYLKHNLSRFFGQAFLPALGSALAAYFGYHAVWGEGGYFVLRHTQADLAQEQAKLAQMDGERARLEHRIELLKANDHDMIEELARSELMNGAPGQVAVPRDHRSAQP